MSPSTKAGAVEKPARLADLYAKCKELAAKEEREMGRIASTMLPLLDYLDEPVVLRPANLGKPFRDVTSASIQPGASVVTKDSHGRVRSIPLAEFGAAECLAILRDCFPELQRLVADRKRASMVRPVLSMKLFLGGQRFILDMRSYRLLVSNSGGDCRGLRVTVRLPDGRSKPLRERDLGRGGRLEVDLGLYKEIRDAERLELEAECKDVDGRELRGGGWLMIDGISPREIALAGTGRPAPG